jgi:hypothetical protein
MSKSEIDLSLEYKKLIDIENDDGIFYFGQLRHNGETRLTNSTSEILYRFTSLLINKLDIKKIFHFCSGDIGFFNCLKSSEMWNFVSIVFDNIEIVKKNEGDNGLYLLELEPNALNYNFFDRDLELVLKKLKDNDYVFLVTDLDQCLSTGSNSIRSICKKFDFNVQAVFNFTVNLGEHILLEELDVVQSGYNRGFNLILISSEKNKDEYYFSSHVISASLTGLELYFTDKNSKNKKIYSQTKSGLEIIDLAKGSWIECGHVASINDLKINNILYNYFNQYSEYRKYRIRDILVNDLYFSDIGDNNIEEKNAMHFTIFQEMNNSKIYRIGAPKMLAKYSSTFARKKVVLKLIDDKVSAEYLQEFFYSDFGRILISTIPKFSENSEVIDFLLDMQIPIPDVARQESIVAEIRNYEKVRKCLERFDDISVDSVFDPKFSDENAKTIRKLLSAFEELSDVDKLRQLIIEGESKTVEFKQTLVLDVRKETKEKYIEDVAIKTIAAFLNSDGGSLLIGVDDNRNIVGVNGEIEKFFSNEDKYLLHFKSLLTSRIGAEYYPFINQRIVSLEGRKIFFIECARSDKEVYVDGKDFFVRTNPATDKLEGPRLVNYVKTRFK